MFLEQIIITDIKTRIFLNDFYLVAHLFLAIFAIVYWRLRNSIDDDEERLSIFRDLPKIYDEDRSDANANTKAHIALTGNLQLEKLNNPRSSIGKSDQHQRRRWTPPGEKSN